MNRLPALAFACVLAVTAAGCDLSTGHGGGDSMKQWNDDHGQMIGQVVDGLRDAAIATLNNGGAEPECLAWQTTIHKAKALPAIPSAKVQDDFETALANYEVVARGCWGANDPMELLHAGNVAIKRVEAALGRDTHTGH